MNLDDSNDVIPQTHHKEARNIVFRGNGNNKIAQSVVGNRLITNSLPSGTNACVGTYYDQLNQRVFYFNYNSGGTHGIYIYSIATDTISTLITDTANTILSFDINNPITSINIMYGDPYVIATDTGGDVLYWVDSQKRPSKLNIQRKLQGVYSTYQRSYLDVAKPSPVMPIQCTYENDDNVTINNLKNSLFQFIYRFVYDDNEKSVWSTGSKVPLPYNALDQDTLADPTKNSRINLYFSTGDETVRKIEIAVRITTDGAISDYQFVTTVNKSTLGVSPNNTVSNYLFYNNTTLIPIDQAEQSLLFDYVPREANAQELLNGNVLVYGGIREGYDNTIVSADAYGGNTSTYYDIPSTLFFAQQNGEISASSSNTIYVYLTGAGTNTSNTPTSLPQVQNADFYVKFMIGSTQYTIHYNNILYTAISDVLNGLSSDAISQGFTTSISGNVLSITSTSQINLISAYTTKGNLLTTTSSDCLSSDLYSSAYRFGIVYYDSKGRTNGVVTNNKGVLSNGGLRVNTDDWFGSFYGASFPQTSISIYSQPPSWAKTYSIVRTQNLTYDKNIFWVSDRAFYNDATMADSSNPYAIAYIGISNMSYYNEYIQSTSGYISYDYSAGDRIRFLTRFNDDGTTPLVPITRGKDFEIIGVDYDPNINGTIARGTYIKIKYPTNFIDSNFKFFKVSDSGNVGSDNVANFQNYEIQIYSYRKTTQSNDVYYELGERLGIRDDGSGNLYHYGNLGVQDAINPANIVIKSGDYYRRYRRVPIGPKYSFSAGPYTQNTGSGVGLQYSTVVINVWNADNSVKTITTGTYSIQSQVFPPNTPGNICDLTLTHYPNYATADCIFQNTSSSITQTVRIKGKLPASTITAKNQYVVMHAKIVTSGAVTIKTIIPRGNISTTNEKYEFEFSANIVVPPTAKLFLMTECQDANANSLLVGAFELQLEVVKTTMVAIVESSFTDNYKLEKNSNSRELIFDENAKNAYYPTLVRWSLPNNVGTKINQSNRFTFENYDEYDRQKGDIQRFKTRGSQLRVFQNRGCGVAGIYENMIFNADGNDNLIQTNKILNQIHYYLGEYGIGWLSTSLASSANADYFVDPIRGYQMRLSQDGLTPISEIYKTQYYMTSLATKYAKINSGTLGGKAKVLGIYDFFEEEYVSVFQGYSGQSNITLAFNEKENAYTTFYDYAPEWMVSAEGKVISFKNGGLYVHDNTSSYSTFYGVSYNPSVTFVFNNDNIVKKDFNAITQDANSVWTSSTMGDVSTALGQSSNLVSSDYTRTEGLYNAAFMRDNNSIGGIINGDYLKGTWMQVKFSNTGTNLVYLSGIYINYTISQRNG